MVYAIYFNRIHCSFKMQKVENKLTTKYRLGCVDNETIYLSPPSWDCGWYWGFGYLGNKNCHYHVDGLKKHEWYDFEKKCWRSESFNLYDGIKKHFGDSLVITDEKDLWTFCELMQTFYTLQEVAEVFGRGGSHYTTNPCRKVLTSKRVANKINKVLLPSIFNQIEKILSKYPNA